VNGHGLLQRSHQPQPRWFVLLEVDQELRQPLCIGAEREPTDQRGALDPR
jgi:hypothetical protein